MRLIERRGTREREWLAFVRTTCDRTRGREIKERAYFTHLFSSSFLRDRSFSFGFLLSFILLSPTLYLFFFFNVLSPYIFFNCAAATKEEGQRVVLFFRLLLLFFFYFCESFAEKGSDRSMYCVGGSF